MNGVKANRTTSNGLIQKPLLADLVFDRLLTDIVSGRFQPLERLNIDLLAEELGVSRTPVREALTRLIWARFVEVARNSSTSVAYWDASDMRDRLETAGKLICIVIQDPRLDLAQIARQMPENHLEDSDAADAQVFLNFAELIVRNGLNRVAAYSIAELINPLRVFLREDVAQSHELDLTIGRTDRREALKRALEAAEQGDSIAAECALSQYVSELAGTMSPRSEDRTRPASTLAQFSPETAARSLHAVR